MTDLWGPISAVDWRSTPSIQGRPATEADIAAGRAVFCIPSGSDAHAMSLPACAIYRDADTGEAISIVAIQAEAANGQVFIGARPVKGGNMVCTFGDVQLVGEPDENFFSRAK